MALPGMEVLQNRIDSFEPRRLKKGGKLYIWPHDDSFIASKSNLAEAGFYFSPTPKKEDFDNVTCFMCQKQLGDWEKEDDPFALHFAKCAEKCAWANLRCGLQYDRVEGGGCVSILHITTDANLVYIASNLPKTAYPRQKQQRRRV